VSKIDLHIHSTASDGRFSPAEIVAKSVELGLSVIALTDHDTVNGIASALLAAQAFPELKVIPSVEINTDVPNGEAHVLGYFIDYTNRKLNETLEILRHSRRERAQGMINKLKGLGIHLDWQRVQEIAGDGAIGRPHIAQAMLAKGYINTIKEAFTKYINRGGPAYVERAKITPAEAVKLVLQANGLPVLAHPLTIDDPETMTAELKKVGLVGIEVYYNNYNLDQIARLLSLANQFNLIVTGGSDYHGLDNSNETLLGGVEVPLAAAETLIALAKKRQIKPTK
jgi:hypothetical protein